MKAITIMLLLAHILSIVILELVIYSFPYESNENWKRSFIIGTPLNVLFNIVASFVTMNVIFSGSVFGAIKNLVTLNCSYQDIERLATSCLVSIVVSLFASWIAYQFVKIKYGVIKKFRFVSHLLVLCLIALVPIVFGYQIGRAGINYISIDEVCRKTTTVSAELLSDDQYIEENDSSFVVIKNEGELAFDADKLFLSDNEEDLRYIQVNGGRILPGASYMCVIAGDDGMDIKKKGGSIVFLSNVEGKILDSVVVPALARDESYKKNDGSWEVVSLSEGNTEPIEVAAPIFSADSGFYEDDFYLSLSAEEGATIYYTLDCTDPTLDSASYSRPIHVYDKSSEANKYRSIQNVRKDYKNHSEIGRNPVDKAFVVRAIAVDEEGNQSKIITKTFWIDLEQYREKKVISLVTDPVNLFDDTKGIYVNGQQYEDWYQKYLEESTDLEETDQRGMEEPIPNYWQRGEEWEREANCEIINGSDVIVNQPVGIRIQGNSTRNMTLKRFSVYARKDYCGSKWFGCNILNDKNLHSFVLREGFMNAFVPIILDDRDVGTQAGTAVDVFLDGEYWYSVYLQEKYSDSYFHEHYHVHSDNVQLVKNKTDANLLRIVDNEYSSDEEGYSQINSVMDIQSYIDFICINAYLDNEDVCEGKNSISWRSIIKEDTEYGDARWRWVLYDMDLLWNFFWRDHAHDDIPYMINTFELGMAEEHSGVSFTMINQPLYKGLRKNSVFCRNFVLTFMDLVNTNFRPERVLQKLADFGNTDTEIEEFFTYRADYIVPYMAKEFELKGTREDVTLTSNRAGSPIRLNTIQPEINGEWSGKYYTDYPVTVSVDDQKFDHWEITSKGITKKYYETELEVPVVKGGVKISAIFK